MGGARLRPDGEVWWRKESGGGRVEARTHVCAGGLGVGVQVEVFEGRKVGWGKLTVQWCQKKLMGSVVTKEDLRLRLTQQLGSLVYTSCLRSCGFDGGLLETRLLTCVERGMGERVSERESVCE